MIFGVVEPRPKPNLTYLKTENPLELGNEKGKKKPETWTDSHIRKLYPEPSPERDPGPEPTS